MNSLIRLRLITSLSSTLEFFDFTLLIFLAPVLARNFFPDQSGLDQIMPVLMLFFAGYLARFAGGFLFSHWGDRFGRKRYYQYSIILMSFSTLGIALLPTHATLGSLAPCLLFILRLLQGISLGGEIPGAVVFAAEHSPARKRGIVTGLIVSGVTLGNVLASVFVMSLFSYFGEAAVYDWAWRLAFAAGAILGLIGYWLRQSLTETRAYKTLQLQQKQQQWPAKALIKQHGRALWQGTFLAAVPAVFVSVLLFFPHYQQHYLNHSLITSFSITSIGFLLVVTLSIPVAIISDLCGRLTLINTCALLLTPASFTCFYLLNNSGSEFYIWLCFILIATSMSLVMGVYEAAMIELFPTEARYSGVAFCHNLAFSLFGGLTPLLLEWLCNHGVMLAPGIILSTFAINLLFLTYNWKDRYYLSLRKL
ncbi:MFS transporter [Spongorhabdus nitratireducens]